MESIRVIPRVLLKEKNTETEEKSKVETSDVSDAQSPKGTASMETVNADGDVEGMEVCELDADGKEMLMPQTTLDHVFAACVHRLRLHKGKNITHAHEYEDEDEEEKINGKEEEVIESKVDEKSKKKQPQDSGELKRKNEGKKKETQAAKIARWQCPFEDAYNELMLASHEMHQLVNVAMLLQHKEKFKYTDYTRGDLSQKKKIITQLAKISRQKEYLINCVNILKEGSRSLKRSIREQRMYVSRIDSLQKRWRLVAIAHSTQQALPLRATEPISIDCTYASAGSVYMQYGSGNVNEQVRVQARLSAEARKPVIVGDNFRLRQTLRVSIEKRYYNYHNHKDRMDSSANALKNNSKETKNADCDTGKSSVKVITEISLESPAINEDRRIIEEFSSNDDSESEEEKQKYVDDDDDTGDEGDEDDDIDMDINDDDDDSSNKDADEDVFREVPTPSSLAVSERNVNHLLCSLQHSEFCTELFHCISREATELGDFTSGIGPNNTDSRFCGIRVAYLLSDEVGITVNEEYTIKFKIQNTRNNKRVGLKKSPEQTQKKELLQISGNGSMEQNNVPLTDEKDMDDFLKVLVIVLQQGLRNLHNRVPLISSGNVAPEEKNKSNSSQHQQQRRDEPPLKFSEKKSYIVESVVSRFRHFLACKALRKTMDIVTTSMCQNSTGCEIENRIVCTLQHYQHGTFSICEVNVDQYDTIIRIYVRDGEFILGSVGQPRFAMHTHRSEDLNNQCKSCKIREKWQHFVSKNGYQIFAPPNSIEKITKFVSSFVEK
mmetsp:Transcript_5147/g.6726  ORF Transcript_5147/g.6726 Transcript_5147/m.6726 type:complete len:778 (-) Transcript_5147:53-2386(-)